MRIKEVRIKNNMTQAELAELAGVDFSLISRYERGEVQPPEYRLERIASVLGVSVSYLIGDNACTFPINKTRSSLRVEDEDKVIAEDSSYCAEVVERANGRCELCGNDAPFNDVDGRPYLETHYIQWLSKGGLPTLDNTVALCPNCHKKMHVLHSQRDVNILFERAKNHLS